MSCRALRCERDRARADELRAQLAAAVREIHEYRCAIAEEYGDPEPPISDVEADYPGASKAEAEP